MSKQNMFMRILIIWLGLNVYTVKSQDIDSINISNAEKVICQNFKNCLLNETYLVYNIGDKYIVITKASRYYLLHFITLNEGLEKTIKVRMNHKILQLAFKKESCNELVSYPFSQDPDKQAHSHSKYLYYTLKKEGLKICEFNLPIIFSADVSDKVVYPLNKLVNEYLSQKLLRHWYKP